MSRKVAGLAGTLVVLFIAWVVPAVRADFEEGRYRIDLMNGRSVEGDVKQLEDGSYEVKMSVATVIVHKNEVKRIVALEDLQQKRGDIQSPGDAPRYTSTRREIPDAEIEEILSGVTAEYDETIRGTTREDLMADLALDQESLAEMKRLMGPDAKSMTTPHFVMVYTATDESTRKLGARLEAVWRNNVNFMARLSIPARMPANKLEIFYFGTWKEFNAYNLNQGSNMPAGVLGYYMPEWNRSHFFNFENSFFVDKYKQILDDPAADYETKQRARNELNREVEYQNMEVVQHETGHHIHFNIGLFPKDSLKGGGVPVWLVEGTTMLFEVPPNTGGASIGVLNHTRLYQMRKSWGKHPLSPAEWKIFIIDNMAWYRHGGQAYPLGWAMVNYLYREHRDGYAEYLRHVFARDEGLEMTPTEREAEFEEIFGTIDEDWVKEFYAYLDTVAVKKSALPYEYQKDFDPTINDPPDRPRKHDGEPERDSQNDSSRGRGRGRGRGG